MSFVSALDLASYEDLRYLLPSNVSLVLARFAIGKISNRTAWSAAWKLSLINFIVRYENAAFKYFWYILSLFPN